MLAEDAKIAEHIESGDLDLSKRHQPGWASRQARRLGWGSSARFEKAAERVVVMLEKQQAQLVDRYLKTMRSTREQVFDKARQTQHLGNKHGVATPNADQIVREAELRRNGLQKLIS